MMGSQKNLDKPNKPLSFNDFSEATKLWGKRSAPVDGLWIRKALIHRPYAVSSLSTAYQVGLRTPRGNRPTP